MIETRSSTVTFRSPFTLPGLDRCYPAGSYLVETDSERIDVSFPATRRVATTIMLTSGAMTQAWLVQPADLDAALLSDASESKS